MLRADHRFGKLTALHHRDWPGIVPGGADHTVDGGIKRGQLFQRKLWNVLKAVRLPGSCHANPVSDVGVENRSDKDEKALPRGILRQKPDSVQQHVLPLAPLHSPHQGKDALSLCFFGEGIRLHVLSGSIGDAESQHPGTIVRPVPKQVFPTPRAVSIDRDIGKQIKRHALCEIAVIYLLRLMEPPQHARA